MAFGVVLYVVLKRPSSDQRAATTKTESEQRTDGRKINVKLYFGTPGSAILQTEERSVPYHETLQAQAKQVMGALMAGPKGELVPTIPEGVRLLDVLVTKDGIAYVDLSGEIVSNHEGGTTGEMVTIYSIVNTLTINLPQIHGVQILVDDQAVETLKGHVDLSRPLKADLSLTQQEEESNQKQQSGL